MTVRRRTHRWKAEEDRLVADCAQQLITSLTEGGAFSCVDVLRRIEAQTENDDLGGRRWIAAVRRVQKTGLLSGELAHALVAEIAGNMIARRVPREARMAKREVMALELLPSLDEKALVELLESKGPAFRARFQEALEFLRSKHENNGPGGKVVYPSLEGPMPAAGAVRDSAAGEVEEERDRDPWEEEDEEDDESEVASNVEWWRQATSGEGPWTVQAVLDFAYILSHANEEGNGDAWISSIQCARDMGIVDTDLSYLLLDRVADGMIGDVASDPVLQGIEEQMWEMGLDSGWDGAEAWDGEPRVVEKWKALRAAQVRREEVLKRAILRAMGEEEMAKEMEERGEEFRARIERARGAWGVEG